MSYLRLTFFVFHLAFFGLLPTAGCLPLGCILIRCTAVLCVGGDLCPVGFTVRSPGSWLGGSWVSARLICCCFYLPPPRSCCVVWLGASLLSARSNSYLCHWHISCLVCARARPSPRGVFGVFVLFLLLLFGVLFFFVWLFFVFVFFLSLNTPVWTLGLRTGPRSLSTSQCGNVQDFAQFVPWHKHCVTTWREPRRRRTEKKNSWNGIGLASADSKTAGGGSNPCWSTRESQVQSAKRQRAPTKKKTTGEAVILLHYC